MNLLHLSRRLALGFGLFIATIELWRRWGRWSEWPSIADDVAAGALLVGASLAARHGHGRLLLAAAWGYAAHLTIGSFLGQALRLDAADASGCPTTAVVAVKGVFVLLCAAGLAGALGRPERA